MAGEERISVRRLCLQSHFVLFLFLNNKSILSEGGGGGASVLSQGLTSHLFYSLFCFISSSQGEKWRLSFPLLGLLLAKLLSTPSILLTTT
ncbi:hypothetical protein V6N13_013863 [Hibiscus sabdariffa]